MRRLSLAAFVVLASALSAPGWAQPAETIYAEEPTNGLRLPSYGISGEVDSTATVLNPAGLHFLNGTSFGLVLDYAEDDEVASSGQGVGAYMGTTIGGNVLPRLGLGLGLEFLEPSREVLDPDPGAPRRLTVATSTPLGSSASLGVSYQRYWDDETQVVDGLGSWNAGLAARFGAYVAAGAMVRDLGAPTSNGFPVQRRYELEVTARPLATDRLELATGGRIGEVRADIDAWLRGSVRLTRGLYLRGEVSTYELNEIAASTGVSDQRREYRMAAGLEVSFGGLGAAALASGAIDPDNDSQFRGGTLVFRVSPTEIPSIMGEDRRIERIELSKGISNRKLTSLVAKMRNLERDDDVVGVVVQIEDLGGGWATLQELRRRILALRGAGKKVFAYMVAGTTGQYYVASAADKVFIDPAGGLRLIGYSATSLYFEKLFDMIGVKAQFVKIGDYKSAPEQWTRSEPTEPAWRQRNELYDSLYAQFIAGIAESRGIETKELRKIIDEGPYTAGDLENMSSLVDAVGEPEELEKHITEAMGARFPVGSAPDNRLERWSYPKIAVVYLTGDIVGGKSRSLPVLGRKLVGGDTIAQAIAQARSDPEVEAIVLRIDSPGGSALASEVMAREVFKTRGAKPIICSLGDLAASGGYFAAAGCDTILAEPTTITGSIGIFNGTFDISKMLHRLGITFTTYRRGANADLEGVFRAWTDEEKKMLEKKIEYFYWRFVDAVAKGRNMSREEVDKVARGRVWTGAQAKRIGLVDEFGGLFDAVELAKKRAGMTVETKVQLVLLPQSPQSLLEKLGVDVPGLEAESQPRIVLPIPGGQKILESLPASVWAEPEIPQARLPFSIVWH